ncbi:MAG: hypothetical protein KDA37_00575 [Planctomycetales bacterium]|nr:hypothetical protein [Planctomycetales bacterium]
MKTITILLLFLAGLAQVSFGAQARTWKDKSGKYGVKAELVAYSDDDAILQREDRRLVSIAIKDLSEEDQKYLESEQARQSSDSNLGKQQTWKMLSGLEVIGNVVDYTRRDVTVQRRRGKVYVNDRVYDNLPQVYQRIVPLVVSHFEENRVHDEKTLTSWLVHQKGQPHTYTCEGVVLELPSGDEYAIPFFLFSEQSLELLQPGWQEWAASQNDYDAKQDAAFRLQSLAAASQQNADVNQQIARMQLGLQAVEVGATSLWEVMLYPGRGVPGPPLCVVVPGRDSRAASANAMQRNPGYTPGPVRKVAGW